MLKKIGHRQRRVHPEIWARWTDLVGADLAGRTLPHALLGKTLIIGVATSAWLQELMYLKARLLERLQEEVGPDVVSDIKLKLDPAIRLRPTEPPTPGREIPQQRPVRKPLGSQLQSVLDSVSDREFREMIRAALQAQLDRREP